jgi:hypothetical protein
VPNLWQGAWVLMDNFSAPKVQGFVEALTLGKQSPQTMLSLDKVNAMLLLIRLTFLQIKLKFHYLEESKD